jgi:hypothetical protein
MLRKIDRTFGWLLILANCGHTLGTILWAPFLSGLWVWSLGAAVGGFVLGALNIVRAGRPPDKVIAWITALGTACLILVAVAFGISIGNLFDPRADGHIVICSVLVGFSVNTIVRSSSHHVQKEPV